MVVWGKKNPEKYLDFSFFLVKSTGGRKTEKYYFSFMLLHVIAHNNHLSLYCLLLFCCTQSFSLPSFEMLQPHLCVCNDPVRESKAVVPFSHLQTNLYFYRASVFWDLAVL